MKKYFNPVIKVEVFSRENIVTTSAVDGVVLTKSALNTAGITNVQTKSMSELNLLGAE